MLEKLMIDGGPNRPQKFQALRMYNDGGDRRINYRNNLKRRKQFN